MEEYLVEILIRHGTRDAYGVRPKETTEYFPVQANSPFEARSLGIKHMEETAKDYVSHPEDKATTLELVSMTVNGQLLNVAREKIIKRDKLESKAMQGFLEDASN